MLAATIGPFGAENGPTTEKSFLPRPAGALGVEKPDRLKRNAILDLKLQLMLRPVVAGIQNHDLEPESNINRRSAGIGLPFLVSNGRQNVGQTAAS